MHVCLCVSVYVRVCEGGYATQPQTAQRYSLRWWLVIHMFVLQTVSHHSIEFLLQGLPLPLNGTCHQGRWNVRGWILTHFVCRFVPARWDSQGASKCQLGTVVSIWLAYPRHISSSNVFQINSSKSLSLQFWQFAFALFLYVKRELNRLIEILWTDKLYPHTSKSFFRSCYYSECRGLFENGFSFSFKKRSSSVWVFLLCIVRCPWLSWKEPPNKM